MAKKQPKKKLNEVHKEFIFQMLACGFRHPDITESIKDEFGIEVSVQSIDYYAKTYPDKVQQLRAELSEDLERIGFARKLDRIAYLDRVAKKQFRRRQYRDFNATLKQIAEETGDIIQKHEFVSSHEDALSELE